MKTRHHILFASALVIIITMFNWSSPTASSAPVKAVIAEHSIKIKQFPVLMGDVSYENKFFWSFAGTQQRKDLIKIQQFPILAVNYSDSELTQKFHIESFFSRIHALKNKSETLSAKIKENIIRISNIPVNKGFLSSKFGIRKDPFHGSAQMHKGIDIAAKEGSIVNPLGEGKVIFAGKKAGYGNMVEIRHGKTTVTRYAHLKQYLVNTGEQITIEDTIGLVGQTGRSTGPHLHLEVLFNGKQADPQVFLANYFGSRPDKTQIAQSKPVQKQKVNTMTIKVANNETKQVSDYPQISYQDYVKSVNGLFGLSAPDSFSQ